MPMPVSQTSMRTPPRSRRTPTSTPPVRVCRSALHTRLLRMRVSISASPCALARVRRTTSRRPCASATAWKLRCSSCSSGSSARSLQSGSMRPASICVRSSSPVKSRSSDSTDWRICSMRCSLPASASPSASASENSTRLCSGCRRSWIAAANRRVLASPVASSWRFFCTNAAMRLRSAGRLPSAAIAASPKARGRRCFPGAPPPAAFTGNPMNRSTC